MFDRRRERLAWVCCLGSGKTNQFGAGKCEGSSDKDTTQSLKSIVKSSGIRPIFTTNVSTCGASSAIDYYTEETVKRSAVLSIATAEFDPHITYHGNDFDQSKEKLGFTITFDPTQINTNDDYQEYSDENGMIVFSSRVPKIDGNGSRDDF